MLNSIMQIGMSTQVLACYRHTSPSPHPTSHLLCIKGYPFRAAITLFTKSSLIHFDSNISTYMLVITGLKVAPYSAQSTTTLMLKKKVFKYQKKSNVTRKKNKKEVKTQKKKKKKKGAILKN
ncbi:hypothetical protein mRhiFer1_008007 [Rhinolophus ferrumequinum]|uniref:Uncharacterized protein n=1 Tax=Rhinolophus ferrumequinum TaxID=59479 RepID=A0A7J7WR28_RHIFE|nr:hypothetical protein mRhiFer1_008007 [Rhinolophus ferrumequinum]